MQVLEKFLKAPGLTPLPPVVQKKGVEVNSNLSIEIAPIFSPPEGKSNFKEGNDGVQP